MKEPHIKGASTVSVSEMIVRTVDEVQEHESRKSNLVFFSIDDSGADKAETRKTYDTMTVKKICEELGEEFNITRSYDW